MTSILAVLLMVFNLFFISPQEAMSGTILGSGSYDSGTPAVVDGFVGNTSVNTTVSNGSSNRAYYTANGFTPSVLGTVSYMHVNINNSANGNARMGLYDSGKNLVAQTAQFTHSNGITHVALLSPYILTNQTYYLAHTTDDTYFEYNALGAASYMNEDATAGMEPSTSMNAILAGGNRTSSRTITCWATNTADGS